MVKIFSFRLGGMRQSKSVSARPSNRIRCIKTAEYQVTKASRRVTGGGRNKVAAVVLLAIMLITLCSPFASMSHDVSAAKAGAKVRQSKNTASQRRPGTPSPIASPKIACSPISKTNFSEDKFLAADWNTSLLPGGASVPGYTATYVSTGGNPADFRNIQITFPVNAPNRYFAHLLKGHTYDPSTEGEIVSIDGGYDLKNQIPNGTPTSFALLLYQDGAYYRAPSDTIFAATWSTFNRTGLKATDFVNLSGNGPRNPVFSCAGKPIQIGFVARSSRDTNVKLIAGIDNWSIRFNSTCCPKSSVADNPDVAVGMADATSRKPPRPGTVRSRCCCDDGEAVVDNNGTVMLPDNVDMDTPPVFEYVDEELGEVSDLYPGADTSLDTWCQNYPCKQSIGGVVPKEADNPNINIELANQGIEGVSAEDIIKQVGQWEQTIAQNESLKKLKWVGPVAPNYTPPATPHKPKEGKHAFGGRDIVFVHGLKLEHIFDRIKGKPAAQVDWNQPTSFPADTTNPEFYKGYYKHRAELTWSGTGSPGMGGHIGEFLRNNGFRNRFLIVSYNCSERLDVAVKAVLAQIGDAMKFGTGVVDPLKPYGPPPKDFGTPSFVIVSHSTGGLVTDVAMTAAAQIPSLNADYIPKYCKAHIAAQGAHRGSKLATTAIALSGYAAITAPTWLWPLVRQLFVQMNDPPGDVPLSPYGFQTFANSVLVDLVPLVAQQRWGKYVHDMPVRTLTVVGGHPTFLQPLKFILQPGFDDGVLNIDSQVANPNNVLLWPSGFRTDAAGLVKNFDMGVFGIGANTQVTANIGGNLVSFSVNISNTSLNSPSRAIGYYINQKFDRVSSPGNVVGFPQPFFFAAGATPYISPTGMLQTISAEYGSGGQSIPRLSANPLNRNPNHFSFLQSASDHFKGTHDQVMGFNGVLYGNSPIYDTANGERNFEETRVLTNSNVYNSFPMPYGDNEPLLRPENIAPVVERIRGLRVTFTLKVFKKKLTRTFWVWKRRYLLLDGWETKRQFDYVYESVLKN